MPTIMATNRGALANFTRIALTTIITTPLMMSAPLVYLLVIAPTWFQFLSLQNNGVQTQGEIVQARQTAASYGKLIIDIEYRFSASSRANLSYTGHSIIDPPPPAVGSIIAITYLRDDPTVSQITENMDIVSLILQTIALGVIAVIGFISTTLLALRIAEKVGVKFNIWEHANTTEAGHPSGLPKAEVDDIL